MSLIFSFIPSFPTSGIDTDREMGVYIVVDLKTENTNKDFETKDYLNGWFVGLFLCGAGSLNT